jgi:hypothetical protein
MSSTWRTIVLVHCALQAFGGKLDRRKRILDLMGDAARHVGPGRGALRRHQIGNVVQRDDVAVVGFRRLFACDPDRQITFATIAIDRHLPLHKALGARASRGNHACEFRHNVYQWAAERFGFRAADQSFGRAIENADASLGIDANDACARACQHRFGESTAAVDKVARADDVVALGPQFVRHLVEGLAEVCEIALGTADRNLHVEIARGNEARGADQATDRGYKVIREIQSDPDRGEQHDQRDDGVDQREGYLHAEAALLQRLIFDNACFRLPQSRDYSRIERPGDIEKRIVVPAQFDDRRDISLVQKQADLGIGIGDVRQRLPRRRGEFGAGLALCLLDDREIVVEQFRGQKSAPVRLSG